MTSKVKACRVKDFIREKESVDLDLDRIREIVAEIAAVAEDHPGQNVMIDLRETELSVATMADVLEAAATADTFKALHAIKIAGVVPDETHRRFTAKRMQWVMQLKGIEYQVFTEPEAATEWLSQ